MTRLVFSIALLGVPAVAAGNDLPLRQLIDAEINGAWQREKIAPAVRSDDFEFLRRVYVDLIGTIPNYEETTTFLKDADPTKRARLLGCGSNRHV